MANRFWVGSTANWDATAGTKWAVTSGGAGGQAVPTNSDDVFLDANSGVNIITITATANCKSLTCTGFTGTLTGSSALNVVNNITFVVGMTLSCTGLLTITSTSTLTSGGKTWGGTMSFTSAITYTLADNWTVTGTVTSGGTLNGNNLFLNGGLATNATTNGTTIFNFTGTGSWTSNGNGIASNIVINTAGTLTISGTIRISGTQTIAYTTGTVTVTSSTVNIAGGTVTFNTSGMSWNNITMVNSGGITLTSNLNLLGTLTSTQAIVTSGVFNINVSSSLTVTSNISGNSTIILNGSGTCSGAGTLTTNLIFNTAGTITLSGVIRYQTGTLTYTAGTILQGTSELTIALATTLNTFGMTWYKVTIGATTTITLNSRLVLSNALTYSAGSVITMAGTGGWTVNTFYILTSNNINHILAVGIEYIVTFYFESTSTTSSLKDALISSSIGNKAIFTLAYGATQNVGYTNAVDIDSSRGQTIWTFNGVVTTTFNWNVFTSNNAIVKNFIF